MSGEDTSRIMMKGDKTHWDMIPKNAHRDVTEMLQGRSGAGVPAQPAQWHSYRMAAVRRHARRNPTAAGRTGTDIRESVNPSSGAGGIAANPIPACGTY